MLNIDLTGKIAVVTGGSGNLGRVICRTLAACGADVCVHYNGSREKAERVAQEIRGMGRRAMAAQAVVGDLASVLALRDQVAAELGQPDIIVNNAVAQYKWTSVLQQDTADTRAKVRYPADGSASMSSGASWSQAESSAMNVSALRRISRPSTRTPPETMMKAIGTIATSPTSR